MDYYLLTDMAAQIGYELAVSGAETWIGACWAMDSMSHGRRAAIQSR